MMYTAIDGLTSFATEPVVNFNTAPFQGGVAKGLRCFKQLINYYY